MGKSRRKLKAIWTNQTKEQKTLEKKFEIAHQFQSNQRAMKFMESVDLEIESDLKELQNAYNYNAKQKLINDDGNIIKFAGETWHSAGERIAQRYGKQEIYTIEYSKLTSEFDLYEEEYLVEHALYAIGLSWDH